MYMSNMNMSNRPNKKDRLQRETALYKHSAASGAERRMLCGTPGSS